VINSFLSFAAIIGYIAAGVLVAVRLSSGADKAAASKTALFLLGGIALALHAVVLYQDIFLSQGLNFGIVNAVSLLSWFIVLLLLLIAASKPIENLGIAIFPIAALALILGVMFPSEHILADDNFSLKFHILISFVAYSVFAFAALQAILLAIQDKHLHSRQPGGFVRLLPPLRTMEEMLFQLIGLGFLLMSLSLFSGFVYLEDVFAQHLVHKTFLSMVAWVVFVVLLWGRWRFGWRGKRAIRATLFGFTVLLLAYIGSKVVMEVLLGK